jgi:hypothetical protein
VDASNDISGIDITIQKDSDNDGLTDAEEDQYGTDPNDPGSDNDGFSDGFEVSASTGPNDPNEYPSTTALNLDGFEDYAWAHHSSSLDISGDELTMEAMVRKDGLTENHWIVCIQNIDSY